jgi:dihydroceramidase
MHMTTTPLVHRILTFGKSERYTRNTGIILSIAFVLVLVVHASMDEFLLHAASFVAAIHIIRTRTFRLISKGVADPVKKKQLLGMARFAAGKNYFLG